MRKIFTTCDFCEEDREDSNLRSQPTPNMSVAFYPLNYYLLHYIACYFCEKNIIPCLSTRLIRGLVIQSSHSTTPLSLSTLYPGVKPPSLRPDSVYPNCLFIIMCVIFANAISKCIICVRWLTGYVRIYLNLSH